VSAVVCPHAAIMYSGPVAAHSYLHLSRLKDPELIVVVAPNHNGIGSGVSTYSSGEWETPLGRMKVDSAMAEAFAKEAGIVEFDPEAHRIEHSLEVQLPFLQAIYGNGVPFLPISISFQDYDTTKTLGDALAKVTDGKKVLFVASSDLTHYEPASQAKEKDAALLKRVEKLDIPGFYETLGARMITSCGFGAIAVVMQVCRSRGCRSGVLLKYATSGDVTGDDSSVVGYASVRFQ